MITGITLICSILSGECELVWDSRKDYETPLQCQEVEHNTVVLMNEAYKDEPVVFMFTCLEGSKV